MLLKCSILGILIAAVAIMVTSCTGVTDNQLALDPIFAEADTLRTSITLNRAEFSQLKNEYILTLDDTHLYRMNELMKLVREDLKFADFFHQYSKYYHKGIDHERWKIADTTYRLGRTTLCEMMLDTGELQFLYAGDMAGAAGNLRAVVSEFPEKGFSGYVAKAKMYLQEIEKAGLHAAVQQPTQQQQEVH